MREVRVAFVDLYRQWPGYFVDTLTALHAAKLDAAGASVHWYAGFLHDGAETAFAELLSTLRSCPSVDLLVVDRVWDRALLTELVAASSAKTVVAMQWELPAAWSEVDYRISPTNGDALVSLVDRLKRQAPLEGIPNLWIKTDETWQPPSERVELNVASEFARQPDLFYRERQCFGLSNEEVWSTRYLLLNMGCPYRNAENRSGFLDGLKLPTSWGASGCTFCSVGPYETQSRVDRSRLMSMQLDAIASIGPFNKLVVIDEFIFRDIDTLIELVVEACEFPVTLMVRARPDYLFTYADKLERALATLGERGTLMPYLIGFENFSDDELSRYNKGLTSADLIAAVGRLQHLAATHSNLALSPSHGFILFGPWTTPTDLQANVDALQQLNFRALRGNILSSKLRLYPDNALVARAHADGLLVDQFAAEYEANASVTGYQAELPYRFAHRETARVWDLLHGPDPVRGATELDRLRHALDIAASEREQT